jgi:serine/threonine protein kinase
MVNKKENLEFFFTEIDILTHLDHPNIVKILDANFDGLLIKEMLTRISGRKENLNSF